MKSSTADRLVWSFVLIIAIISAGGCRSRGKQAVKTSPAAPQVRVEAPVAVPVSDPTEEFVREAPEEAVLTAPLDEVNRLAHARGWIRDVFFAFDSSLLDVAARDALRLSADWLRRNPSFSLLIEGHCDERGTEQYNLALGERRANTARDYLIILGVDEERIRTISYGEEHPFAPGHNEAAWAQNRRAALVLERPTFLGAADQQE